MASRWSRSRQWRFLDRKVEASLKPHLAPWRDERAHARFLDRKVEASLKPHGGRRDPVARPAIPRPKGRGLIEARACRRPRSHSPRFLDRKVEASLKRPVRDLVPACDRRFLDRKVEASLK